MATDYTVQLRRAILPILKANTVIASLCAGRVYSESPPALPSWPFIRYGATINTPTEWSCADGSNMSVTIHVFDKTPGIDQCARMVRAVIRALDERTIQLEADQDTGETATAVECYVTQSQISRDGDDVNAHHGIVSVSVVVSSD